MQASTKICPECETEIPLADPLCDTCNYAFPEQPPELPGITPDQPILADVPPPPPPLPRSELEKNTKPLETREVDEQPTPALSSPSPTLPPNPPTSSPPPPPTGDSSELLRHFRIEENDFESVVAQLDKRDRKNASLFGLFGRPATGKSSFVYALGQNFRDFSQGFGGYVTEGGIWSALTEHQEAYWRQGRKTGTGKGYYFFDANNTRDGSHLSLLDIAGEHFENVESWADEVYDFFGAYLGRCDGYFLFLELNEHVLRGADSPGAHRHRQQLKHIVSFLSVAANVRPVHNHHEREALRRDVDAAAKGIGKAKVEKPVALCLTKADRIHTINLGPELGFIRPGQGRSGDPMRVLESLFSEEALSSLHHLAPRLKVEWVSCLGPDFEEKQRYTGSPGLASVFRHVVEQPPPPWSLSAGVYHRLRRFWFMGGES